MHPEALFAELTVALVGHSITFTRLAANSLLLYVDCEPGDKSGFIIWFEPIWHMSAPEGVLVGSQQAQGDSDDGANIEELDQIGAPLQRMLGHPVTAVEVDHRTHDLTLTVDNKYFVALRVKTFRPQSKPASVFLA